MGYSYGSYSEIGTRDKNEDSIGLRRVETGLCAALGDGMGGYRGGEIASGLLIKAFDQALDAQSPFDVGDVVRTANSMIISAQQELGFKMKTTAAVVKIDDRKAAIAHVGDSRVYAFKDSKLVFCTTDHSAAQMCVDIGEITLDGIRSHPDRCVLTRALGSSEEVKVELNELAAEDFDSLLICSDGFWGSVWESEMCSCLENAADPNSWLEGMRKIRRSRVDTDDDNNTAVAIMKERE